MLKQYNRNNAVSYAKKWALNRNPKFYAFDNIGGDCTNFISQCLLAGGGVMDFDKYFGWFYISQHNRSPSWASVEYLQKFLLSNNKKGPFAKVVDLNSLLTGDIIQLKQNFVSFNHSLIISQKTGNDIYVCAHDGDSLNRPLSSYNYISLIGLHIQGIYEWVFKK